MTIKWLRGKSIDTPTPTPLANVKFSLIHPLPHQPPTMHGQQKWYFLNIAPTVQWRWQKTKSKRKNLFQLCKIFSKQNGFYHLITNISVSLSLWHPRNKKFNNWICHTPDHDDYPNLISGWRRVVKSKSCQIDPKFQLWYQTFFTSLYTIKRKYDTVWHSMMLVQ